MNCANCQQPKEKHEHNFCPDKNFRGDEEDYLEDRNDGSELHFYQPEFPKHLNVYQITQAYGGPEEGGWWFDAGVPCESVVVDSQEEREQVLSRLRTRYQLDEQNRYAPEPSYVDRQRSRGRTSAAGGYDIRIQEEYEFAQPFPQERPRYE